MESVLTPYSIIRSVQSDHAMVHLCDDGVIEIHFEDFLYNLDVAHNITKSVGQLAEGGRRLILGITSDYTDIDSEARHFLSTPDALMYSVAEAYVLKSLSLRLLGNFYLKFQRPPVATRFFSEPVEARIWLLKQKIR